MKHRTPCRCVSIEIVDSIKLKENSHKTETMNEIKSAKIGLWIGKMLSKVSIILKFLIIMLSPSAHAVSLHCIHLNASPTPYRKNRRFFSSTIHNNNYNRGWHKIEENALYIPLIVSHAYDRIETRNDSYNVFCSIRDNTERWRTAAQWHFMFNVREKHSKWQNL